MQRRWDLLNLNPAFFSESVGKTFALGCLKWRGDIPKVMDSQLKCLRTRLKVKVGVLKMYTQGKKISAIPIHMHSIQPIASLHNCPVVTLCGCVDDKIQLQLTRSLVHPLLHRSHQFSLK